MICIGEEVAFQELLENGTCTEVSNRIEQVQPKTVPDLGCEYGFSLVAMYHCFASCVHLEGMERRSKRAVLKVAQARDKDEGQPATYTSLHQRYFERTKTMTGAVRPVLETEEEFDRAIQIRYCAELPIVKPRLDYYDLIIASNILHGTDFLTMRRILSLIDIYKHGDTLIYIHIKSQPGHGYGGGNSWIVTKEYCTRAAADWGLRTVVCKPDERALDEGVQLTFTNF